MANKEIKTTLVVDGEKQYKKQITEANSTLKTLRAQLALETSALSKNATEQDKARVKVQNLKKQIQEQEKIVNALESSLKTCAQRTGENSTETNKYRLKLMAAKTTLNNMNKELATAETNASAFKKKLEEFMDDGLSGAIGKVADKIGEVGIAAAGMVTAVATAVVAATKSIVSMEYEISGLADDLLTTSSQTGIGVEDLQKWKYAEQFIDTTAESIESSIKKLRRSMSDADKAGQLEGLGINLTGADGEAKKATEVFWDLIDAMHGMLDANGQLSDENLTFLEGFTGKGADELLPLIQAGSKAWQEYGDRAVEVGYVMSEQDVQALGAMNDDFNRITLALQAIKREGASIAFDFVSPLVADVATLAEDFSKLLSDPSDPEKQQAFKKGISTIISEASTLATTIVQTIRDVINELLNSDDENIKSFGKVLSSIFSGFEWAVNNVDSIVHAIETIFEVFVGLKATQAIAKVAQLVASITNAKAMMEGLGGANAASGAAGGAAASAGGATSAAATSVLPGVATVGSAILAPIAMATGADYLNRLLNENWQDEYDQADAEALARYIDAKTQQILMNGKTAEGNEILMDQINSQLAYTAGLVYDLDAANAQAQRRAMQIRMSEKGIPDKSASGALLRAVQSANDTLESAVKAAETVTTAPEMEEGYINSIQNQIDQGTYTADVVPNVLDGSPVNSVKSHATGIANIPYDGYLAYLHKGEAVLTENSARRWRAGGTRMNGGGSNEEFARQIVAGFAQTLGRMSLNIDGRQAGGILAPSMDEILAGMVSL